MQCISCSMEIDPKWQHAIEINNCPFCGKMIMDEQLKNNLSLLNETMKNLAHHPNELNDWLLSNFNYIKIDSKDLRSYLPKGMESNSIEQDRKNAKFLTKVKNSKGEEEEIVSEKIQSDEKTEEFSKRAEAVKPNIEGYKNLAEKTQHLKTLAQQIKRAGASTGATLIASEMAEVDENEVAEMQQNLAGGGIVNSSLDTEDNEEEIPAAVLAMASRARGQNSNAQADIAKLVNLQNKTTSSRNNFASGRGGFSRG